MPVQSQTDLKTLKYMQKIDPDTLVAMDTFTNEGTFRIDLAYARDDNLLFGQALYRSDARLWLHENLAKIVRRAARDCHAQYGYRFVLYDGLRTVDAQEAMLRTRRVKQNPHWIAQKLLSPPGGGGHPRGMAVDIGLENEKGDLLDMGTPFDYLAESSSKERNPAHREYRNLSDGIRRNRNILTFAMVNAAQKAGNAASSPAPGMVGFPPAAGCL